jgi:hypothetical protein
MWFIDQNGFSPPLIEVLVNRDDFGGRGLEFSALDRNIELVSARANGHNQPVS